MAIIFEPIGGRMEIHQLDPNRLSKNKKSHFIKIKNGKFFFKNKPYYYLGTNFWYGPHLASPGKNGNQERLIRELDHLKKIGVDNLRIMVGSEGANYSKWRVTPTLQTQAGTYNSDLLQGLDFLLDEMKTRNMVAVLCFTNFWLWSGGFAQYLQWANGKKMIKHPPELGTDWDTFEEANSEFYSSHKAREMLNDFIEKIVTRTNSCNRIAYKLDPTIQAWQLANEPRGHHYTEDFIDWVKNTSSFIRSLDSNHLISVGSEGISYTHPDKMKPVYEEIHKHSDIDYLTFHLWIQNWEWYQPNQAESSFPKALEKAKNYLSEHIELARKLNKPLVLEEFGIARDQESLKPETSIKFRDQYYQWIFNKVFQAAQNGTSFAGSNFWAWGGEGRPHPKGSFTFWKSGEDWIGDPPHEQQGWYSIFNNDNSTLEIIKNFSHKMRGLCKPLN